MSKTKTCFEITKGQGTEEEKCISEEALNKLQTVYGINPKKYRTEIKMIKSLKAKIKLFSSFGEELFEDYKKLIKTCEQNNSLIKNS